MEKLYFLSDSLEPMSCHLSTRPRVAHQTSPNQTPIDKRRIKTIFNHFRDKPARGRKRFCGGANGRKSNTSRVQNGARMKKLQVKGSFFLKDKGRFFKVITIRPVGDNRYVFDCRELDSKKKQNN